MIGLPIKGATVAIEGFGNVGQFAAKFLSEKGAKIIAVSDSKGTIFDEAGLNVQELISVKEKTGSVINYPKGKKIHTHALFELKCDILIPGARPDVITKHSKDLIKTKLIVEAANIPISEEIEEEFHGKGIWIVPDFVANAGGVISSYVEFIGGDEKQMFSTVKEKIRMNTKRVLEKAKAENISPRAAALELAKDIVRKAMQR